MRKQVIVDLKLLATGIGLGGLICAASSPGAVAAQVCGVVAIGGACLGLFFRLVEGRL